MSSYGFSLKIQQASHTYPYCKNVPSPGKFGYGFDQLDLYWTSLLLHSRSEEHTVCWSSMLSPCMPVCLLWLMSQSTDTNYATLGNIAYTEMQYNKVASVLDLVQQDLGSKPCLDLKLMGWPQHNILHRADMWTKWAFMLPDVTWRKGRIKINNTCFLLPLV